MKVTNRAKSKTATGAAKGGTAVIRRLVGGSGETMKGARQQTNLTVKDAQKQASATIRAARKEARRQMIRARIAGARARAGGRRRAAGASKKAVGAAGAVGLAAGYFLDPDSGRRRRNVARDRALALMRRGGEAARREATYREHQVEGKLAAAANKTNGETSPPNDQALAERVKSEIFQPADAPKGSVNVNVERGVVYLRGEVKRPEQIRDLVEQAGAIDGVAGVENLLHTP